MPEFDPAKLEALKASPQFDPAKLEAVGAPAQAQNNQGQMVAGMAKTVGNVLQPIADASKSASEYLGDKAGQTAEILGKAGVPSPISAAVAMPAAITSELLPKDKTGVALSAIPTDEIGAMAGKALEPLAQGTKDVFSQILGTWTGRSPEAVKELIGPRGSEVWKLVSQKLSDFEQANVVTSIENSLSQVGKKFHAVQDALAGFPGTRAEGQASLINLKPALAATVRNMEQNGHILPEALTGYASKLKESGIKQGTPDYNTVMEFMGQVKKASAEGRNFGEVLNIKRNLDDAIDYGIQGQGGLQRIGNKANNALQFLRDRLNLQMRAALPAPQRAEWDAVNSSYSKARTAYDEIRKEVIKSDPQATLSRVLRELKSGRAEKSLSGRASQIGEEAQQALQNVHDRVVASQFRDFISGRASGLEALVTTAPPRAVGKAAVMGGDLARAGTNMASLVLAHPQVTRSAIEAILANAENQKKKK